MSGYDGSSCNALEKPFYRPIEAAIRWCGLIAHEAEILAALGAEEGVSAQRFPQWPCLRANTEKILDAIANGSIAYGRNGKTVAPGEQVTPAKRTVRHADLREWMTRHYPDQKPEFLFDQIERNTHSALNADSFRTLQADLHATRTKLDSASKAIEMVTLERDRLQNECHSLRAKVEKGLATNERNTLLTIIAAICDHCDIEPTARGAAKQISDLTERFGASVTDDTIRKALAAIPDAIASRKR